MTSTGIKKRSVIVGRCKTSVSLEEDFWVGLREIARHREVTLNALLTEIQAAMPEKRETNLSSAIRLFVYRDARAVVRRAGKLITEAVDLVGSTA